jgi:glucose/arabinose dehydrogenase/PKD repeat protein
VTLSPTWARTAAVLSLVTSLAAALPAAAQPEVPPKFVVENAVPGAPFNLPTCIAFLPDGRLLVGEKAGKVWVVKNGIRHPVPMWSREREVQTIGDCGLMSIAVDPAYSLNRFVYFLYTADPDSNNVDTDPYSFGRLTRYRISTIDSNVVDTTSRAILMGVNWTQGPLTAGASHTVGSLRWGEDGSLLVSIGEGAESGQLDPGGLYPNAFGVGKTDPSEDIGAFRAQNRSSLGGKVLRINPQTGRGYSNNPWYQAGSPGSVRSRIWNYGMRNPFRICVRPGSGDPNPSVGDPGSLFVGDVGWATWEEANLSSTGGQNFGWPCYEGNPQHPDYQAANPASFGCATIGTPTNPAEHTPPLMSWHHSDSLLSDPPGAALFGNCSLIGQFYNGTDYPTAYQGALFFCDFGMNWMKIAKFDAVDQLVSISDFATNLQGPVDFAAHPVTKDLHYVSIVTGTVRRIRYTGPVTDDPVAVATGTPLVGQSPTEVTFDGSESFSPIGRPITHFWNFGDGLGSPGPTPIHIYQDPGVYDAVLSVSDDQGRVGRDTLRIVAYELPDFPTTEILDNFDRPNGPLSAPWTDIGVSLAIADNQLTQTATSLNLPVWNGGVFAADQEAFMTLNALTPTSPHHTLMLKVQGTSYSTGHIQVRYDANFPRVTVATYAPEQGWVTRGEINPWTFHPGDRLGARAYSNGVVEVYDGDMPIGTFQTEGWPFSALGGRIGLVLQNATSTLIDDFGGGDTRVVDNDLPVATIVSPPDGGFFAADTVWLVGQGTDEEDEPGELTYHWQVDTYHNNHIHPGTFLSTNPTDFFIGEDHDDGTGVWMVANLMVTDTRGAVDSARVTLYPEVDLLPMNIVTDPSPVPANEPAEYSFWLHNRGRMLAARSHWTLRIGGSVVAEGDTVVPALDSLWISRILPSLIGPGVHSLRATADTTARVVETVESNNGLTVALTVDDSSVDVTPPLFLVQPSSEAYGVHAFVMWTASERSSGKVYFGPTVALGDSAPTTRDSTYHRVLIDGLPAAARVWYRVRILDSLSNSRISALDSLQTFGGPLSADVKPVHEFALSAAFPNPSRGAVRFAAELPEAGRLRLVVYDLQGRMIWDDGGREANAGRWTLEWPGVTANGGPANPGMYLARVHLGKHVYHRRLALIR